MLWFLQKGWGPFKKKSNARVVYTSRPRPFEQNDIHGGAADSPHELDDDLMFMLENADVLIERDKLIVGEVIGTGTKG